jgi:site-specific DNA-methyltransferase (adenine-specific)
MNDFLNKILNEDCLQGMKRIPDKSIDLITTDIPYYKVVKADFDNQWKNEEDYLNFIFKVIDEMTRILKDNGSLYMFTSRQYNRHIATYLDKTLKEQRIIIWKRKRAFNNTRGKALNSEYEPICYYSKGDKPVFNNMKVKPSEHLLKRKEYQEGHLKEGVSLTDVWEINALPANSKEKTKHETQKPLEIIERTILLSSNEGDIILDPFMGSGTTAIAALKLNRKYIGFEKENKYYQIISERINNFK